MAPPDLIRMDTLPDDRHSAMICLGILDCASCFHERPSSSESWVSQFGCMESFFRIVPISTRTLLQEEIDDLRVKYVFEKFSITLKCRNVSVSKGSYCTHFYIDSARLGCR